MGKQNHAAHPPAGGTVATVTGPMRPQSGSLPQWSRRLFLPEMASGCYSFSIPCFRPETTALWHSCPANGKAEVTCELVT